MKKIKLTYFDHTWGRALATRIALRMANIGYEDERVVFPQFEKMRGTSGQSNKVPLGVLPTLEVSSSQVSSQSMSIARYAGKRAGLYPLQDFEKALLVDEVMETTLEMMESVSRISKEHDGTAENIKQNIHQRMTFYLEFISRKIAYENGPYLLGKEVSIADLVLFQVMYNVRDGRVKEVTLENSFFKFPTIKAHFENVERLPAVRLELAEDQKRYCQM